MSATLTVFFIWYNDAYFGLRDALIIMYTAGQGAAVLTLLLWYWLYEFPKPVAAAGGA